MSGPAPRIKICCIASVEEARVALAAGADAIGLVSAMPSGPGPIADQAISEIAAAVPPGTRTFLLTSRAEVGAIAAQVRRAGVTTVQVVDHIMIGTHRELRMALPDTEIVQVIHVRGEIAVEEAQAVAPFVDAILLDSGNPDLQVKELGGTGRTHDWLISRRIRDEIGIPVWLAGGLRPDNVAQAVALVHPHGLDVCSGVRVNGRLDADKVRAFIAAARNAA